MANGRINYDSRRSQLYDLLDQRNLTGGVTKDSFLADYGKESSEESRLSLFGFLQEHGLDDGQDYDVFKEHVYGDLLSKKKDQTSSEPSLPDSKGSLSETPDAQIAEPTTEDEPPALLVPDDVSVPKSEVQGMGGVSTQSEGYEVDAPKEPGLAQQIYEDIVSVLPGGAMHVAQKTAERESYKIARQNNPDEELAYKEMPNGTRLWASKKDIDRMKVEESAPIMQLDDERMLADPYGYSPEVYRILGNEKARDLMIGTEARGFVDQIGEEAAGEFVLLKKQIEQKRDALLAANNPAEAEAAQVDLDVAQSRMKEMMTGPEGAPTVGTKAAIAGYDRVLSGEAVPNEASWLDDYKRGELAGSAYYKAMESVLGSIDGLSNDIGPAMNDFRGLLEQRAAASQALGATPEGSEGYEEVLQNAVAVEEQWNALISSDERFGQMVELHEKYNNLGQAYKGIQEQFPTFFADLDKKMARQAQFDAYRRKSLMETVGEFRRGENKSGTTLLAKLHDTVGVTIGFGVNRHVSSKVMEMIGGIANLSAAGIDLLSRGPGMIAYDMSTGRYDGVDYFMDRITRTTDPNNYMLTSKTSREMRPMMELIAEVDGYKVAVNGTNVYDSGGFLVHDREQSDMIRSKYEKSPASYPSRSRINSHSVLNLMADGAAQVAVTAVVGGGLGSLAASGLSQRAIMAGTQMSQMINPIYRGALQELGVENRDEAWRYALGSAFAMSVINEAVNPLESQLAGISSAINMPKIANRQIGLIRTGVAQGMSPREAVLRALGGQYTSARKAFGSYIASSGGSIAKEGFEGVLEFFADRGVRAAINTAMDPGDPALDMEDLLDGVKSNFAEEAVGSILPAMVFGLKGVNRMQRESLHYIWGLENREELIGKLDNETANILRRAMSRADQNLHQFGGDAEAQIQWLTLEVAREANLHDPDKYQVGDIVELKAEPELTVEPEEEIVTVVQEDVEPADAEVEEAVQTEEEVAVEQEEVAEVVPVEAPVVEQEAEPTVSDPQSAITSQQERLESEGSYQRIDIAGPSLGAVERARLDARSPEVGDVVNMPDGQSFRITSIDNEQGEISFVSPTGNEQTMALEGDQSWRSLVDQNVDSFIAENFEEVSSERQQVARFMASVQAPTEDSSVESPAVNPPADPPARESRYNYDSSNIGELESDIKEAGIPKNKRKNIGRVVNVVRSMRSVFPNVKVRLHPNRAEFKKAAADYGFSNLPEGRRLPGMFTDSDMTIHINMQDVGKTTAFHEGIHPLIGMMAQRDPERVQRMYEEMIQLDAYKNSTVPGVARRYEAMGDEVAQRESLVEFFAQVASGDISIDNPGPIKNFFKWVMELFGIDSSAFPLETGKEIVDFANKINAGFRTGRMLLRPDFIGTAVEDDIENREIENPEGAVGDTPQLQVGEFVGGFEDILDPARLGARNVVEQMAHMVGPRYPKADFVTDIARHFGIRAADVDAMYEIQKAKQVDTSSVTGYIGSKFSGFLGSVSDSIGRTASFFGISQSKKDWLRESTIAPIGSFFARYFTAQRGAPAVLNQIMEASEGELNAIVREAEIKTRKVVKLALKEKADPAQVKLVLSGVVDYDSRDNVTMSDQLFDQLIEMRAALTGIGRQLVDDNLVYGKRREAVLRNMPFYLTRQYRAFFDPSFKPDRVALENAINDLAKRVQPAIREQPQYRSAPDAVVAEAARKEASSQIHRYLNDIKARKKAKKNVGQSINIPQGVMKKRKGMNSFMKAMVDKVQNGIPITDTEWTDLVDHCYNERSKMREMNDVKREEVEVLSEFDATMIEEGRFDEVPWLTDLSEPFRKLLGEYEDPFEIYLSSVFTSARYMNRVKTQLAIQRAGMGKFVWRKSDLSKPEKGLVTYAKRQDNNKEGLHRPVEGFGVYAPVIPVREDLLMTKEAYEYLEGMGAIAESMGDDIINLVRGLTGKGGPLGKLSAAINWMKTVASMVTGSRNINGNIPIMVANGYFIPSLKGLTKGSKTQMAASGTYHEFAQKEITDERLHDVIGKLRRAGVINQSIAISAIKDALVKGSIPKDLVDWVNPKEVVNAAKKGVLDWKKWGHKLANLLNRAYSAGDNFFKVYSFMVESDRYANAIFGKGYSELSPSQKAEIDAEATEMVKNQVPNYSRLSEVGQILARSPFFGSFVSFKLEMWRVTANIFDRAYKEMSSSNPKLRAIGKKRMGGIIAVTAAKGAVYSYLSYAFGTGLYGFTGWMFGDDEDEEKQRAYRKFMYPWLKKSDVVIAEVDSDGIMYLYDISSVDPFSSHSELLNAFWLSEDFGSGLVNMADQFVSDMIDPTILADKMMAGMTGLNSYGQPIWNNRDGKGQKVWKFFHKEMLDALLPGTIHSFKRISSGKFTAAQSIMYFAPGITPYAIDLKKMYFGALQNQFTTKDPKSERNEINRLKNKVASSTGEQQAAALKELNDYRREVLNDAEQTFKQIQVIGAMTKKEASDVAKDVIRSNTDWRWVTLGIKRDLTVGDVLKYRRK